MWGEELKLLSSYGHDNVGGHAFALPSLYLYVQWQPAQLLSHLLRRNQSDCAATIKILISDLIRIVIRDSPAVILDYCGTWSVIAFWCILAFTIQHFFSSVPPQLPRLYTVFWRVIWRVIACRMRIVVKSKWTRAHIILKWRGTFPWITRSVYPISVYCWCIITCKCASVRQITYR